MTEEDPDIELRAGELTEAQKLRASSLLGSSGMLRILGGVFHNLREGDNPAEAGDIIAFFKQLDPYMAAPITENSFWYTNPEQSSTAWPDSTSNTAPGSPKKTWT